MRALVLATAVALVLTASACGDDDDSSNADPVATAVDLDDVPDVVGQSVDDATATLESAGLSLRVVRRDGEDLAATMDFVPTRVDVAVETEDDGTEVVTEILSTG